MSERSPHEKSLNRVIVVGTSLSFGALAAVVASMQDFFGGNAAFHLSGRTALGFLIGAALGLAFWWLVGRWQKARGS
jgi:hypothetical protein